jgi:hypothetical protein
MKHIFFRLIPALSLIVAGALFAEDKAVKWEFNGADSAGKLVYAGAARIEMIADPARQGVLTLEKDTDMLTLQSGLSAADFQDKNFTISLLFRHNPLPAAGNSAAIDMILFKSDRLTIALRKGNDGGNAGTIFANLKADQKNVLFKPERRVDDGQWHGVTLRADSKRNRIQIFLDGRLYASRDFEGTSSLISADSLFSIGPGAGTQIDDIKIYNTVLDDSALLSDYNYAFLGLDSLGPAQGINSIRICIPPGTPEQCRFYAGLFSSHILRRAPAVRVTIESQFDMQPPVAGELIVYAGVAGKNKQGDLLFQEVFNDLPSELRPGQEGYAVKLTPSANGYKAWLAGVDERGFLYGLGRLLYLSEKKGPWIQWPALEECSAPRVAVRSMNGPSFKVAMDAALAKKIGARSYTTEEGLFYWEEDLFLGVNLYTVGRGRVSPVNLEKYRQDGAAGVSLQTDEICKQYGVDVCISQSVNGLGTSNIKPGWNALSESGLQDPHLGCLSVPESRQAIIETWAAYAKESKKFEYALLQSADIAGCHCPACQKDWPKTFYDLCCDIARAVHQWKPAAKLYFTNQAMSIEENERLFSLMRTDKDCPLAGFAYAPGGSENSTYGDILKNPEWNRYPSVYPDSTFLKSRLNYLRPDQDILAFPDVSHWKRAECAVPYIDPIISEIYPRRTYNARPNAYENVFRERMPYCTGLSGYSEGNFDDFNKFFILRLLWNPELSSEEIAREYYTYYCGSKAGLLLARAVFLGEQIYEKPFRSCGEIIRQYQELVKQAGECMPPEYRKGNWRYSLMVVRSQLDFYIYQRTQFQQQQMDQAVQMLTPVLKLDKPEPAIREAVQLLSKPFESGLLVEAKAADDAADAAVGIRSFALTIVEKSDAVGVSWLKAQLELILKEKNPDVMLERLGQVLNYDKVGSGEFYDNCGTLDQQPHYNFSSGNLYYGTGTWPEGTRPSQRWYNYSFEAQDGLEFSYNGLDKKANYTVTVTCPNPGGVSFAANSPNEFYIYADGEQIGKVTPPNRVEQFTFDVPFSVTEDGLVHISLRKVPGQSRSTCISEIWLRKKK